MSDNYRYNLWDEVYKLQNKEMDDFNGIIEALREIYNQIETINPEKNEHTSETEINQENSTISM